MFHNIKQKAKKIKEHIDKFGGFSAGYFWVLVLCVPALVLWHWHEATDPSVGYFLILFLIPVIGAFWFAPILFAEAKHLSQLKWIGIATISQVISWSVYIYLTSSRPLGAPLIFGCKLVSWANLSITVGLVGTALAVTRVIMNEARSGTNNESGGTRKHDLDERETFRRAMRERPLPTLLLFLVLFLDVAYSLSFALAIQDITARREVGKGILKVQGVPETPGEGWEENPCEKVWGTRVPPQIFFEKNRNFVQKEDQKILEAVEGWAVLGSSQGGELSAEERPASIVSEEPSHEELVRRLSERNSEALSEILLGLRCAGQSSEVRVSLRGRTDEDVPSKEAIHFSSNYELGHARVQATRQAIVELIEKSRNLGMEYPQVVWTDYTRLGGSMEDPLTGLEEGNGMPSNELSTSVSFSVPAHKPRVHPTLLDYLYFTIYTITTTGYGDILPVSLYAKFLASIANLYELFFIVIFFNVLLSFARGRGGESVLGAGRREGVSEAKGNGAGDQMQEDEES